FLNWPGVCAPAGVAASAALASTAEALASFMNPLRSFDIFLSLRICRHHFLRRPLMFVGGEFFRRSWIAERRSRVCPLCSWRKTAWQQPLRWRFALGQKPRLGATRTGHLLTSRRVPQYLLYPRKL